MKNMTIAITAAAIASAASAGVVDMQYTGMGAGSQVQLTMGAEVRDTFAGEIYHTIANGVGADAYLNGSVTTFCPDISETVTTSFEQYTVTDVENIPLLGGGGAPMGTVKADAIRALYSFSANTLIAGGLSNAFATAFQLVIWEVVEDFDGSAASMNVDAGNTIFKNTDGNALDGDILAAFATLTSDMMNALANGGGNSSNVVGLSNAGFQDQLVAVPAPGAMALLSIGGLVATRRRRS